MNYIEQIIEVRNSMDGAHAKRMKEGRPGEFGCIIPSLQHEGYEIEVKFRKKK